MNDVEKIMEKVLHRCAFLQISVREGLPPIAALAQASHLATLLEEALPLLVKAVEDDHEKIKMQSLHPVHEDALAEFLEVMHNANPNQGKNT